MENQKSNIEMFGKFTWTITNFSTIDSKKLYSDKFSLDGHTWRILLYPKRIPGNSHILVHISEHERQVDESVMIIDNKLVESIESLSAKEMISTSSFGEAVDFRGIGKVDKNFIPLLEEVCSWYPSLIDSKKNRSQRFTEWAFTALGRVLHFLNTKKLREMDHDAYNNLQILWEEVETFGFDLEWLIPHVQFALGVKTHVERALEVKRLEENVTILEMEAMTSRTKMIEAMVNLRRTRRDLVKTKDGFEECDLDAELGYGGGEKDLVRRMSHQELLEAAFEMSTRAALLMLRDTETAEDRVKQLKEKLAILNSDLDKALKVNFELNAKLPEMIIAHSDCEKKQEDVATRLFEARVTEKHTIETGRKFQKNNDDLTLKCQKMKKVIEELVMRNTEFIQQKTKLVEEAALLCSTKLDRSSMLRPLGNLIYNMVGVESCGHNLDAHPEVHEAVHAGGREVIQPWQWKELALVKLLKTTVVAGGAVLREDDAGE
ncbi:MATH domain and coiled-coil domain-containing protein [Vigna angularis]|uniref:MATH domain and coiled-coil domain-containing protein n=1 Tax=Phaseolus angularis TaxID=3914 RepID=A0A8T0KJH8_PHAAN|nr:MATH domain and coiled-coil domain-containing protein [Vigna angularis]